MKKLTIRYFPAEEQRAAQTEVHYQNDEGADQTSERADFAFDMPADLRRDIQWYLEEYLIYPWGLFCERAARVEAKMVELGEMLFGAVFSTGRARQLYGWVSECLPETDIIIQASDPAGIAVPWELLRDPLKGETGDWPVWRARSPARSPILFTT